MPYILPEVIDPDRISVCVPVPDDDNHRRAFLGALYSLTYSRNWERDAEHNAALVSRVWTEIYEIVSERLDLGEECGGAGVDCCDDILTRLAALDAAQRALMNLYRAQEYDGTPGSINPSAPSFWFDQDDSSYSATRDDALCVAARQYVYGSMQAQIDAAGQAIGLAAPGAAAILLAGGPVAWVVGAVVISAAAFLYQDLIDAAADQSALDDIVCQLYKSLKGLPVSQSNFSAAIDAITFPGGHADTIAGVVKGARSKQEAYFYFLDVLGASKDAVDLGAEADCCGVDCEFETDFRITSGGAYIRWGSRNLSRGLDATEPFVSGWWADVRFVFDEPCSFNRVLLLWRDIGSGGSRDVYYRIQRASDGVWSPVSGYFPKDQPAYQVLFAGAAAYLPASQIRFVAETYGTGPVLGTIEKVGVKTV